MKGNTKSEKLEKEAGDYAEKHAFRVPYDGSNKFYDDVDFKASKEGYIVGAKPREKQISELKYALGKLEYERIQLIARLAFTENSLNNSKAKNEKAICLITELSKLEHRADDYFTYDEYLKLIKDAKQFLNDNTDTNKLEEKSNNLRFENESGNDKTHEAMYTESKVLNAMKLLKASCEGKTLQTPNGKGSWIDCNTENIIFYDLLRFEYRIKEEDEMSRAQTCIYDTDSCRHAKYEFGEPDTLKCKDCNRNPNMKKNEMEEKSNNLRLENAEPPVSPSSVKTNDVTGYMHCDDENLNNEQLSWTPYYSYNDELRNNLKSIISTHMNIDEKVNIVIALCRQMMVQVSTENPNPYNQPKVWYNYRGDQINPNDVWCNSKPNPYMPYEYCSTQLKSDTENNDLVHVPIGGTIYAELYNIIKDRLKYGIIKYHECDGTRIDKKEYETLYNIIGHKYDDVEDNAEVSDFKLPKAKGLYIRIR